VRVCVRACVCVRARVCVCVCVCVCTANSNSSLTTQVIDQSENNKEHKPISFINIGKKKKQIKVQKLLRLTDQSYVIVHV
jgi:hypothetical protein